MITVIIIDDEPPARMIIRKMLGDHNEFAIVAECENGPEAIAAIEQLRPDLIFLDVQMPEVDGFEVLKSVDSDKMPLVIFVTAYDKYAVRAFEVHALDYLLKPFDRERFEQTLDRARDQPRESNRTELSERILRLLASNSSRPQYLERLIIKSDGRIFFVKTDEIEWIEAEGNYVSLNLKKTKYLFREAISSLEKQLDPKKFQRIHRSSIVNLDSIKELHPWFRGDLKIILRDGTELRMSHRYRANFEKHFGGSL
ncbi:MAG TPA: LytTR family DNA-binding domain-containing protein [Blastocatellia bacterium]|nr:LytTR family DNA-binding domain-containing protein [Blastocatellia bacterium]